MKFFKRFYNPFKPHIVQFSNDEYAIRRWALGWEYLDTDIRGSYAGYWWGGEFRALKYCSFTKLDSAKAHLENYLKPKVAFARRVE
ncbi:hypothetical protein P26059A_0078 [Curvibacter phage P26059A]|nr:hypothetical protein P26059A_0078 [Curvibacter phage P26059A]